jgi:hypothetical protein
MSVMQALNGWFDRLTGRDEASSITVPVMDGPLKPNATIDTAPLLAKIAGAGNLVVHGTEFLVSRGNDLLVLRDGIPTLLRSYPAAVTALSTSPAGDIAAGLSGQGVTITDAQGTDRQITHADGKPLTCVTALCFLADGNLAITNGARDVEPQDWARDLMLWGRTGLVAHLTPGATTATVLADGLRFPSGISAIAGNPDRLAVSEAWAHRIIEISRSERRITGTLATHLPSYPSRIIALAAGGYVLTNYAVRSQLIEFILREKRYLRRMLREVPPEYWIAPTLSCGHSFKEPLQAGGIIRLGVHKPWAPSRSYGLLIGLDAGFSTVWSAHSRANGIRHGVTSAIDQGGRIIALAQGNGEVFALDGQGQTGTETEHQP